METRQLIINTEGRFASYKKLLEDVNKERDIFNSADELVIFLKSYLREQKNTEEKLLKKLTEEKIQLIHKEVTTTRKTKIQIAKEFGISRSLVYEAIKQSKQKPKYGKKTFRIN